MEKTFLDYFRLPSDLALWLTRSGSNYPCLEQISMVPKMFEPFKFDCMIIGCEEGFLQKSWRMKSQKVPYHYENIPIQIYWKFYHQPMKKISDKNSDIFHIASQKGECGYSLEWIIRRINKDASSASITKTYLSNFDPLKSNEKNFR